MKRKESTIVKKLHRYRQLMPYMMPTRNEAVVYFENYVNADKLQQYLAQIRKHVPHVTITHMLIKACSDGIHQHPTMNRYVSGHRIYQRDKVEISFSAKKKKAAGSRLKVVKMEFTEEESVAVIANRIHERLNVERSNKKTYIDKEIDILSRLPRFVMKILAGTLRWLDYHNFLPHSMIKKDPLYSSLFIANLGSFGMEAGYHHLYEYGNTSIFLMAGKIEDRPVVEDGKVVARPILHLRWSFDERIEDAFTAGIGITTVVEILENPFKHLGDPKSFANSTNNN